MVQTNAAAIEHSAATHTEASSKCQKVYISFPVILPKTECVYITLSVNHRTPLTLNIMEVKIPYLKGLIQ